MDEKDKNWAQRLKAPNPKFPKNLFTFYLSHPHPSRHKVREWELGFEKRHPKIALINPFYDVEGEGREDIKIEDAGGKVKTNILTIIICKVITYRTNYRNIFT